MRPSEKHQVRVDGMHIDSIYSVSVMALTYIFVWMHAVEPCSVF